MASIRKRATKAGVVYDVHYRDTTGASRQKSFRRKAEADKFRATVVAAMARGDWIDPRRARETVADWAAKWIASKSGLKPSSLDRCQVTLELRILPRWANTPIGKVMHEDVVAWIATMDADGQRFPVSRRRCVAATTRTAASVVAASRLATTSQIASIRAGFLRAIEPPDPAANAVALQCLVLVVQLRRTKDGHGHKRPTATRNSPLHDCRCGPHSGRPDVDAWELGPGLSTQVPRPS